MSLKGQVKGSWCMLSILVAPGSILPMMKQFSYFKSEKGRIGHSKRYKRKMIRQKNTSAPTILLPWVRVPNTPSTLLSFIVKFLPYFSSDMTENKQKEAGFGPF